MLAKIDQPLIPVDLLPAVIAAGLLVGALLVAVGTIRGPSHRLPFGVVGVVLPAIVGVAWIATAIELPQELGLSGPAVEHVPRFVAYAGALPLAAWLLGRVGAAGRTLTIVFAVATFGHVAGVAGWLVMDGDPAQAALGLSGVLGLVAGYLLVGPVGRASGGARELLYERLRALLALCWAFVLIAIVASPVGFDLFGEYVGLVVGGYLDLLLAVGAGVLVLRSGDALDGLAAVPDAISADGAVAAPSPDAETQGVEPGVGTGEEATDGGVDAS